MASDFKKMEQKSTFSYFSPHQLKVISEIYLGASTGPLTEPTFENNKRGNSPSDRPHQVILGYVIKVIN